MRKSKGIIFLTLFSVMMSGCNNKTSAGTEALTDVQTAVVSESVTKTTEIIPEAEEEIVEERITDRIVCDWLYNSLMDSEEFTDMSSYQYYARTLGLDKDYFLNPSMWEAYYNPEININNEINGQEIYLIRLNPYLLLDIYAKRNECTVDELCSSLSATKEQLYYNWGYNPAWVEYDKNHAALKVFASQKEIDIFGISNGEDRAAVMRTHMLTIDTLDNNVCYYSSYVGSRLVIRRMDMLGAVSADMKTYSEYSEQEKTAAFTVNGIGIRAVIPLSLPNAWVNILEPDNEITPFVNVSPFSYGCTDEHKIEIKDYSVITEEE